MCESFGSAFVVDCAEWVACNYEATVAPGDPDADGTSLMRSSMSGSCESGVEAYFHTLRCPGEGHGSLVEVSECAAEGRYLDSTAMADNGTVVVVEAETACV